MRIESTTPITHQPVFHENETPDIAEHVIKDSTCPSQFWDIISSKDLYIIIVFRQDNKHEVPIIQCHGVLDLQKIQNNHTIHISPQFISKRIFVKICWAQRKLELKNFDIPLKFGNNSLPRQTYFKKGLNLLTALTTWSKYRIIIIEPCITKTKVFFAICLCRGNTTLWYHFVVLGLLLEIWWC